MNRSQDISFGTFSIYFSKRILGNNIAKVDDIDL